jgi:hypothetical protein
LLPLQRIWAALFFCAFLYLLFSHAQAPMVGDYADWTYEGVQLRNMLLGHANGSVALKSYPVPNSLETIGIGPLWLVFSWQMAAKVWLALYLTTAFAVIHDAIGDGRKASLILWAILPGIFTGLDFWYGFINFLLAVVLTICFSSMLFRNMESRWKHGLLLVLIFFTHFIPFAFSFLLFLLYAGQTKRFRLLWQAVPAAALTAWYVLGRFTTGHNVDGSTRRIDASVRYLTPAFFVFKANSYLKSFDFVNPRVKLTAKSLLQAKAGDTAYAALFLLNAALAAIALWMIVGAVRASFREKKEDRFFWTAFLLIVPVYWFSPAKMLGILDPGGRLLQAALWPALVVAVRPRRSGWALTAAAIPLSLVNLWLFATLAVQPYEPQAAAAKTRLPDRIVKFGGAQYAESDCYYKALEEGNLSKPVFPTGLFEPGPSPDKSQKQGCY